MTMIMSFTGVLTVFIAGLVSGVLATAYSIHRLTRRKASK